MSGQQRVDACLALFELTRPTDIESLKNCYRDLVQVWHPDRHANNERLRVKAEEKLKEINQAYAFLLENVSLFTDRPRTATDGTSSNDAQIQRFLELAAYATANGNHPEAYSYYSRCLELDTTNAAAWLGKGTEAGWLTTVQEPRLVEMVNCYAKALTLSSPTQREDLRNAIEVSKIQLVTTLAPFLKNQLMQVLPLATIGPAGIPDIWPIYLKICNEMIEILDGVTQQTESAARLTVMICKDNLAGAFYGDAIRGTIRSVKVTAEYAATLRSKMERASETVRVVDPDFSTSSAPDFSLGCGIASLFAFSIFFAVILRWTGCW